MSHTAPRYETGVGRLLRALPFLLLLACPAVDPLEEVRALHREGHYEASLEPLRVLLAERDDDPELHYRYGLALRRSGEPGLAVWSLRRASQSPDWQVIAGLELAAAAVQNHSFPAAIEAATRVLEADPDNYEALHLRGVARLNDKRDLEGALSDFERMLERDAEDFPAQAQRIAALLLLGRADDAQQALAALDEDEVQRLLGARTRAHLCVARATFAFEQGDSAEAGRRFDACVEEFPAEWVAVAEAVRFFDEQRRSERSDAILRAAIEEQPTAAAFRNALAERLAARGRAEEAEALLRAGTQLENQSAATEAWTALANHFLTRDEYAAAAEAYERALDLRRERDPQELLNLADLLALAGQHQRALEMADGFEEPLFRDLIHARVHLERNEPREALVRLDAALRLWPDNASARYFAARASEQLGDFERAIEEYRQSIRSGSERTDAALRLARLHAAEGAPLSAVLVAGHYIRAHPEDTAALLFSLREAQQLGDRRHVDALLATIRSPAIWAEAQAVRAEVIGMREGAEAAVALLRGDPRIDLASPRDAAALRVLVIHLQAAGRHREAQALVEAAFAAHPESAEFLAIQGLLREQQGAAAAEVRPAYEQALALDPQNETALLGMARLEGRAGVTDSAVAYCERAMAADPSDPLPGRTAAFLLAEAGRDEAAEERLEEHLREYPHDGKAALALARLRIARGAEPERTRRIARQAERFGAAREARSLLGSLEPAPSE